MFNKNPVLHIYPSDGSWTENIAQFIYSSALVGVRENSCFSLCLAGGNTPISIYKRLAKPPYQSHFPWKDTFVFWGDERSVPSHHPDSNYKMATDALLSKVPIPPENLFPIRDATHPEGAAMAYDQIIRSFFKKTDAGFDLTLLGMGDDGHTASLFPGTSILEETNKNVAAVYVEKLGTHRISLTAKMLNQSKAIAFLVKGERKQNALRETLLGGASVNEIPAKSVQPIHGEVHWMFDQEVFLGLYEQH